MVENFTKSHYIYAVSTYNPRIKFLALALSFCRLLEWPWTKCHAGIRKPVIPCEMRYRTLVSPFLRGFEWCGKKYWENCHKDLFISSSDPLRNKVRVERQSASSKPNHQGSPQISAFWIDCLDNTQGTYNGETTLWPLQLTPERLRWWCCSPSRCLSFLHIPRVTMEREVIPRSAVPGQWCSPCGHCVVV